MSSVVEVILSEGGQAVSLMVTDATTSKMLLQSMRSHLSDPDHCSLVLNKIDGTSMILADDVPVLACKPHVDGRLMIKRRVNFQQDIVKHIQAVSSCIQNIASKQFRATENIRRLKMTIPT